MSRQTDLVFEERVFVENGRMSCGKHEGISVDVVALDDPGYLRWILDEVDDLDEDSADAIVEALDDARLKRASSDSNGAAALASAASPPPSLSSDFPWTAEQLDALAKIAAWRNTPRASDGSAPMFALTGAAGTGKSTLMREVVKFLPRVALSAMTGRAAMRLAECVGGGAKATTLHAVLYYPPDPGADMRFERVRPPNMATLLVDESSMVTPSIYRDLQTWAAQGVYILLVGDPYQLPPVITSKEEKARFGEDYSVFALVGGAELKTVMRSVGGVIEVATRIRTEQIICTESNDAYDFVEESDPIECAVQRWLADPEDHALISWRNAVRMDANTRIRAALGFKDDLSEVGEPVLIRKNGSGYLNGEVVECAGWDDGPQIDNIVTLWMRVEGRDKLLVAPGGDGQFFDGGMPYVENYKKYFSTLKKLSLMPPVPVTWGYCLTAHAAQGGEFRRATVFLGRGDERSTNFNKPTTLPNGDKMTFAYRFAYTALTRAKQRATFILGA